MDNIVHLNIEVAPAGSIAPHNLVPGDGLTLNTTTKKFKLISSVELTANPTQPDWLVRGMIERESINLLFGEPGSYKSFVALDWAFCVACGIDWHGHKTKQNDVVIVAGEGFSGYARRLKALEQKYKRNAPNLYISETSADFIFDDSATRVANAVIETCANVGLIIIDTLHRNMTGDENSSADIGTVVNNIDHILKPLGAAVVIVHHSGHGAKDRSRGSSSIRGAMDAEFGTTKSGTGLTLTCHKMKDSEMVKPLEFTFNPVDIEGWADDEGQPVTSGVLEFKGFAEFSSKKIKKLSSENASILTSLDAMLLKCGTKPSAEIAEKYKGVIRYTKVLPFEEFREDAMKYIVKDTPEAKRQAFGRCWKTLRDAGEIIVYEDFVFTKIKTKT